LMVTIAIAAIVMAMAVPGFRTLTQNSQQRNAVSDVNALLSRMRVEVAARRIGMTVCASANQATCSGTGHWEDGWIVFVDGSPGVGANGALDAGETIIQVHAALPRGVTLRSMGAASAITLTSEGLPITNATFRYCDERGISSLRALIVGPSGVVRSSTDGKDHGGSTITSCT